MSVNCPFFRVVLDHDKNEAILKRINSFARGEIFENVFIVDLESFKKISGNPICYWVSKKIIEKISTFPDLNEFGAKINVGLQTGDDFRFLRNFWEVASEKVLRRDWIPYTKTDYAIPWYSPIILVVNWHSEGMEIKNFSNNKGIVRSRVQNIEYYGLPGLSYMLRSTRLVPYIIPKGCIPTAGRSQVYPKKGFETDVLILCASNFGSSIARFKGEKFGWPKFQASMVQSLPFKAIKGINKDIFTEQIRIKVQLARNIASYDETSLDFLTFNKICLEIEKTGQDFSTFLGRSNEELIAQEFGLSKDELIILENDLLEAVSLRSKQSEDDDEIKSKSENVSGPSSFLSYVIGCIFGRWDILFAIGDKQSPPLSDPFAPLPVCPLGMLQNNEGLPATESPFDYPLIIQWNGILVEDPGHPQDIVQRVKEVIKIIHVCQAEAIEAETCSILGLETLKGYFKKTSAGGFWDDHIKRYSKSKRKSPIYWKLSSFKGNYSIWLYYPRITRDTLFVVLNEFVNPKIELEDAKYQDLKQRREREKDILSQSQLTKLGKEIESKADFINELKDFKKKINDVAKKGYDLDFDDGVILNMAPLHEVIPWKEPKAYWEDLEEGKYDWAHIAMKYWPDRVKDKCKKDKSIAIAHGMEHLYEAD